IRNQIRKIKEAIKVALVNGKWLEYDERAALIAEYKAETELLVELIKTDKAVEYDINRLEHLLDEIKRIESVHKGEYDVLYFGMTYFSEDGNEVNADNLVPSGVNYDNAADFHKMLCGLLDDVVSGRQRTNVAWACPRGHAKTAWLTNLFLI